MGAVRYVAWTVDGTDVIIRAPHVDLLHKTCYMRYLAC